MALRLLLANSRLSLIIIDKVEVFTSILLHKVLIVDDLHQLYGIKVTHTKFRGEIHNLLVLLIFPNTK